MKNIAKYTVISIFILMLCTACPYNKGAYPDITSGSHGSVPSAPYVEGGISLVVSQDKNTIELTVEASGSSNIVLERADKPNITSNSTDTVTVNGRVLIIKPGAGGQLTKFTCIDQKIMRINASGCKTLTSLTCNKNLLDTLKVHTEATLTHVTCTDNRLMDFDAQFCKELVSLECGKNNLTSLNLTNLTHLKKADCRENPRLTQLTVTGCINLENLDCSDSNLTALTADNLSKLKELDCSKNKLTQLTVTGCTQLAKLDISGLNQLQTVLCHDNKLDEINITDCTELKQIECYNNDLKENAFTTLLNALPNRTSAETEGKIVLCKKEGETGNITDFTTPEALTNAVTDAKNKNWKLYKKTCTDTDQEI